MTAEEWFFWIWTVVLIFNIVMTWLVFGGKKALAIGLTAMFVAIGWGFFLSGVYIFPS